jgi:alanine racemase
VSRPTILTVDLDALRHNFNVIRAQAGDGVGVWPVVKADAYGLGSVPIAQALQQYGAAGFGVATTAEGVLLRDGGITAPVLLLGGIYPGEGPMVERYRLTSVVHSLPNLMETAAEARRLGATFDVHLKVDTGMNRLGVRPEAVEGAVLAMRESGRLRLSGVLSHFADSDPVYTAAAIAQLDRFEAALATIARTGENPRWIHLANSAGLIAARGGRGLFNAVRPGILLYGSVKNPDADGLLPVRPVATLRTEIVLIRPIAAGERVSYGGTWTAPRVSTIAVLPLGYADGLRRDLSNKGEVLVRGKRAPIVGTVCMDMVMVDVTDVPGAAVGDPAIVFGAQDGATIPLEEVAAKAGTIPYEILTGIHWRVPRIYVHGDAAA